MRRRQSQWERLLGEAATLLVILAIVLPLLAVLFGSIQTERALLTDVRNPLPKEITLANFRAVLSGRAGGQGMILPANVSNFPRAFVNSVVISLSVTFLTLVLGALSAYAVCRLRVAWVRSFMYANIFSRMVPVITLLVPLYILFSSLRLLNTLAGVIMIEVGFLLPYSIWILAAYFSSLPGELEDAARVDGCSRLGALVRIILPLSAPGMAASGVILFMMSWHELMIPLIISARPEATTVPVVVAALATDYTVFYTVAMAVSIVGLAPSVLLALALRRYVVHGLTAGALKG